MGVLTQARELAVLERAASDAKAALAVTSPSSMLPLQRSQAMMEAMSLTDLRQEMNSTWAEALSSTMKTASQDTRESGMGVARVSAMLGEAMRPLPVSPHTLAPQAIQAVQLREMQAREEAVRLMAVANSHSPSSPKRSGNNRSASPARSSSISPLPTIESAQCGSKPMAWPKGMDDEQINNLEVSEMRKRVRLLEADLRATDASLLERSIASMETSEISSPTGESTTAGARFGSTEEPTGGLPESASDEGKLCAALCEADRLRDQASVAMAQSDSMEVQRTISEQTVDRLRHRLAEVQTAAEEDKIARARAEERAEQAEAYSKSLEEQLEVYTAGGGMVSLPPTVPNTPVQSQYSPSPDSADSPGAKTVQLEAANISLQQKFDTTRNELKETRKKWARSMSQSQIKFRSYLLLVDGMGQQRRMGLEDGIITWRKVVEEANPNRERTPLNHVLQAAQAKVQTLSEQNKQLQLRALETDALLDMTRNQHAALEASLGMSSGDQAMYTQIHELKTQLATSAAQHAGEIESLHEAWATEMARADDADKRATALGGKANESLLEAKQKSFATGAQLQASFIEDRALRLQSEIEMIQVTNLAQKISSEEQKTAREAVCVMAAEVKAKEARWKEQLHLLVQHRSTGEGECSSAIGLLQQSLDEALAENSELIAQLEGGQPSTF